MEQRFRDARDAQFSTEEIDYNSETGRRALAERMNFADDPFLVECYEPLNSHPCIVAQRLLAEYTDHCRNCGCQCGVSNASVEEAYVEEDECYRPPETQTHEQHDDGWWEQRREEPHQTTRPVTYARPAACMLFDTRT
jgi:hypothetical protein